MKLTTLLLSSAAAFAVAGGAQAADLSIAEPVDYVRVCDAIGVGYWYIPGTDTCLRIGGHVRFDVNIHSVSNVFFASSEDHSAGWDFKTSASLNVTAKSMTEFGILTGYIETEGDSQSFGHKQTGSDDTFKPWQFAQAYLELGPGAGGITLLAGHTGSTFDYAGGFVDPVWRSDTKTDQIRLSWAMSGFGLMLGVEDPTDRWGTSLSATFSMPDIIAAITASQGAWDGKLSAGFAQLGGTTGGVWGVNGGITIGLDSIAPGDQLRLNAAVGTGASFVGGGTMGTGATHWSAFASFQHFWSAALSSAFTISWLNDGGTGPNMWGAGANLVWVPVTNFSVGLQGIYKKSAITAGAWTGRVRLERKFGS